jgi:dephospho-CoA kinase
VQLERLLKRDNCSVDEASARIAAQMPLQEKLGKADLVINNNGSTQELKLQVKHAGDA